MNKLYLDNGYLNFDYILSKNTTFNFIIGGRGIGKTYGALKYLMEGGEKFFFLRRTQTQIDTISLPEFSPFKSLNEDFDRDVKMIPSGKYMKLIIEENEKGENNILGAAAALSTISNIRGFDSRDIKILVFDEFIPEKHERLIKNEADAFFNAYETINRNRELSGSSALKVIALSNSNNISCPIFSELGLINTIDKMIKSGKDEYVSKQKDLSIFNIVRSPISERKKETALYKITKDNSEFYKMSIENSYGGENYNIANRKLIEYKPIVNYGDIGIYIHKSNHKGYVSFTKNNNVQSFSTSSIDKIRFKKSYSILWEAFIRNKMEFESAAAAAMFVKIWE